MAEIIVPAAIENLDRVLRFVDDQLQAAGMDRAERTRAALAAEEIYVNIARYAYDGDGGSTVIRCDPMREPLGAVLEFIDSGRPFNPFERKDPDITLPAEKREIGGLGVYLTKLIAHKLRYVRVDGKNHLIMTLRACPPE